MPFINKVTVRGTTYYLENLTDGSNIVRLPKGIAADDYFVTQNTLGQFTVSEKELEDFKTEITDDFNDFKTNSSAQLEEFKGQVSDNMDAFQKDINEDLTEFKAEVNKLVRYELPVATDSVLGGVKAAAKDDAMTREVGVDADGKLWVATDIDAAKEYTDSKAYSVEIVDVLPAVEDAEDRTFYLIPKASGKGYEKYWKVTHTTADEEGNEVVESQLDEFAGSATEIVASIEEILEPDEDVDYIVYDGTVCLYYKWISGNWCMVAGSVAKVLQSADELEQEVGNEHTDYYVKSGEIYFHYRWDTEAVDFVMVGSDSYNKTEIDTKLANINTYVNSTFATKNELTPVNNSILANAEKIAGAESNINQINSILANMKGDNDQLIVQYDEVGSVLHLYERNENGDITITEGDQEIKVNEISSTIIVGGGGGGDSLVSTIKMYLRVDGEQSRKIRYGTPVSLYYNLSTLKNTGVQDDNGKDIWEENTIPGDITISLYRDNVYQTHYTLKKTTIDILSDSFDISDYVLLGAHTYTLKASYIEYLGDGADTVTVRAPDCNWSVEAVNLNLIDLPDTIWETTPKYGNDTFYVTPVGDLEKTIYFQIDDNEPVTKTTKLNGTAIPYTITKQSHGIHTLRIWCEGIIGEETISTDVYEYILMFVESGNNTPIIRIKAPTTLEQYSSANIYYNVLDPLNEIIDLVTIYDEDGTVLSSVENITSAEKSYEFKPLVAKTKTITIKYKEKTESVIIEVTEFPYEINAVTGSLMVDFVPTGRTNSDTDYNVFKNNAYTTETDDETGEEIQTEIPMTWKLSDNFDWINGGWKTDSNGDTYFCIKAGTFVDINYNLFGTDGVVAQQDAEGLYTIAGTGKEFKLIFKTTNVAKRDAIWLQCLDAADNEPLGIRMEAQNAYIDSSLGTLEIPYVDDDIIEFDMNIVPMTKFTESGQPDLTVKAIPMIMTYEDGTPVQPKVITTAYTNLKQDVTKPITIGSEYCDVHIYRMKVYERYLTDKEILSNFIADARSGAEMARRYVKNDIYPVENKQKITPESVAAACPDLKVYVLSAPYFTNDKGDKVENTTIQQIHNTGTKEKPVYDPSENWIATNAIHNGQGTSSNEYGYSGRNLEFNMKKATITLNDNITVVKEIQLSPTSYPTNYLNFKINIASSENANNALHQKRYDRYLPYTTVASLLDDRKKNSMEFYNCVVFIQETNEDISTHREFGDTDVHFYGIGNIGDSKKTDDLRTNDPDDPNEFCVEIMDWNRDLSSFPTNTIINAMGYKTDNNTGEKIYTWATDDNLDILYELVDGEYVLTKDTSVDYTKTYYVDALVNDDFSEDYTYGWRYILDDENADIVNSCKQKWIEFYKFVTRDLTTDGVEDKTKVAAWKEEFSNWFIFDAAMYYYLYTLRYTMVDNRAKNLFLHWGKHYLTFEEAKALGIALYDENKQLIEDDSDLPSVFYDANGKEIKNINATAAAINNGYRMEFWDYDNDTSLGIDNAGKLEIPFGVEDNDEDAAGVPYFRANDSLLFTRIAKYFEVELENTWYNTEINPVGKVFDSTSFINEFDIWQEQFPEELWRLDYERKYKRTYVNGIGEDWDNALPKSNKSEIVDTRFLTEMMNGRKKYQRRCFERNQEIYMSSKFKGEVNRNDTIQLRGTGMPTGKVVEPNFSITITPFSKMYVNLYNSTSQIYVHHKLEAGETETFSYPNDTLDFIYIRGGSQIQSLGDLSPMYLQTATLTPGAKLKEIILGNPTTGYSNDSLQTLDIGSGNKLLEELDIRNLSNLGNRALPVSNIPSLKRVYAQGSNINSVVFANNGLLEEAYLPEAITRLEMRNLYYVKTLELASYDSLLYLIVDNCPTMNNWTLETVENAKNLKTLRATGINWEFTTGATLNRIAKMNSSLLEGFVKITGPIRQSELDVYAELWPDLHVEYDLSNIVPQYEVAFFNYDRVTPIYDKNGNPYVQLVDVDQSPYDPTELDPSTPIDIDIPIREETAQYKYIFVGWEGINGTVPTLTKVFATYNTEDQYYNVYWHNKDDSILHTVKDVKYGEPAVYGGSWPTYTTGEAYSEYNVFASWDISTSVITGETHVHAIYETTKGLPTPGTDIKDMTVAQIYSIVTSGNSSNYFEDKDYIDIKLGNDYSYNNVAENTIISSSTVLDGSEAKVIESDIKLCGSDSPAFTMAIDFEFGVNDTSSPVRPTLVSCFENANSKGMRLFYGTDGNPTIQWGDQTMTVGYGTQRNMVVIRHEKGKEFVHIYAFNGVSAGSGAYSTSIDYRKLTRTTQQFTDRPVIIGGFRYDPEAGADVGKLGGLCNGTVHWVKVWNEDLGDADARNLAAWTHETIRFQYCGSGRYQVNPNTGRMTGVSFICENLLAYGYNINSSQSNVGGWEASDMRDFCNERVYNAFPTVWKSVIKKPYIPANIGNNTITVVTSQDYIYLPSYVELTGITGDPYDDEGYAISWMIKPEDRIKKQNGIASKYWTRSAMKGYDRYCVYIAEDGFANKNLTYAYPQTKNGICPCFSI